MVKRHFTCLGHAGVNGCDGETEFAGGLSKRSAGMVRVEVPVASDVLLVPLAASPTVAEMAGNDRPPTNRFTHSELK